MPSKLWNAVAVLVPVLITILVLLQDTRKIKQSSYSPYASSSTRTISAASSRGQIPATAVDVTTIMSANNNTTSETPGGGTGRGSGSLWIHIVRFAEGISNWRVSLDEILRMAKAYNATFVEPCVHSGRLESCSTRPNQGKSSLRLRDVLDLEELKFWLHDKIVSHEEFVQATGYQQDYRNNSNHQQQLTAENNTPDNNNNNNNNNNNIFTVCLGLSNCTISKDGIEMATRRQSRNIEEVDRAIQSAQHSTTILDVLRYRRKAFQHYKTKRPQHGSMHPEQPTPPVENAIQQVGFPKAEYTRIQILVWNKLNINIMGEKFAAIQWRPEVKPINYTACAQAIMEVRNHISERDGIPKNNFILISPLSLQKELQWGGVKTMAELHQSTSYPALQMLLDVGFHKLEELLDDKVADGGVLAIWDFILAETASTFAGCSKQCDESEICSACNYQGSTVGYILGLRNGTTHRHDQQGKTDLCWPHDNDA